MCEQELFTYLLQILEKYRTGRRKGLLLDYHSPEELKAILNLDREATPGNWDEIFYWIEKYLQYSTKTDHPSFVNRMWTGANLPSILGEIVVAVSNSSACTYESAPVSTLMEKYLVGQMLEIVGFSGGEGQMTTGSSNANMIAMMVARNLKNAAAKTAGLFGEKPLFALVGADAHYSMDKAANILGIGSDHLVKVDLTKSGEMDITALERALQRIVKENGIPFFVGATAGTTVRGAYDPLPPIVALQKEYDFWLHVDGAWGGTAVLSAALRQRFLEGLEAVNSFTCDFHKMVGTNLMCNVLLLNKSRRTLGKVLSGGDSSYIFHDNSNEVEDLGSVSLQCGRRIDSLKWFLDWKFFGQEGLGKRVEKSLSLCRHAENYINSSEHLEMVVPRNSFNVCFRYIVGTSLSNIFNLELRNRLYRQGLGLVGSAVINNRQALRLLLTSPDLTEQEVNIFLGTLVHTAQEISREH